MLYSCERNSFNCTLIWCIHAGSQMPSIRLFRTFLAVATEGSFTAAAHKVALTQAAVGLQMRTLEDELQRSLFDREGKTVTLNDHGRALLPQVRQMLTLYGQMLENPDAPDAMTGTLHLGSIVSALPRLLRATLALKQLHPGLDLHVSAAKSSPLVTQVESGQLDCAVMVKDPSFQRPDLVWQALYAEPMVLLASPATGETPPKTLLTDAPFIRFDRAEQTGQLVERTLRRLRARPREFLELNSMDAIADLVRSSLGVAILPMPRASGWRTDPRLRVMDLPGSVEARQIALVRWRDTSKSAVINAVCQQLLAQEALSRHEAQPASTS